MRNKKRAGFILLFYLTFVFALVCSAMGISRAVTVISENLPLSERKCVIIDAGHGGEDGGATSCSGILESKLNLEIALRLNDLFHILGTKTCMIRTEDISVHTGGKSISERKVSDLKERVRIINETQNAFLISVHQNYFSESQYRGPQVFYGKTSGSQEFARELQTQLNSALVRGNHRQCKKSDGIYLMEKIQCPGILLECGFLSNPQEDQLLQSPEYQKKLSCLIVSSLNQFLHRTERIA